MSFSTVFEFLVIALLKTVNSLLTSKVLYTPFLKNFEIPFHFKNLASEGAKTKLEKSKIAFQVAKKPWKSKSASVKRIFQEQEQTKSLF